jgi:hypothetical protein
MEQEKIQPSEPKNGIWAEDLYGRVTYPSINNFTWRKKKYIFRGLKRRKQAIRAQKRNLGPKINMIKNFIVCSCDISIDKNFTWSKKKYTLDGEKRENKPSEPKNGNQAPKSIWSCARVTYPSIGKFTWSKKKYTFGVKKARISLQNPKTETRPQKS